MVELLFLLLPLAFYSGWRAARKRYKFSPNKNPAKHYVQGINYLLNEEPDKALDIFINYPEIDKYTAETYELLGNLFRQRGEVDRALRVHQNLVARTSLNEPQKFSAMYALGQDFFSAGMLDRAESVFRELLNNIHQSRSQYRKQDICAALRVIYEQTQDWEKAIKSTQCILADLLPKKGKIGKDEANKAEHFSSYIAHYYCQMAEQALTAGNIHQLEQLLDQAGKHHADLSRIMILEADSRFHQRSWRKAMNLYLQAIEQDRRLIAYRYEKLSQAADHAKKIDKVRLFLDDLFQRTQDNHVFIYLLMLAQQYPDKRDFKTSMHALLSENNMNVKAIQKSIEYLLQRDSTNQKNLDTLQLVNNTLKKHLRHMPNFICDHCGYKMQDFLWQCPACHEWDSLSHV